MCMQADPSGAASGISEILLISAKLKHEIDDFITNKISGILGVKTIVCDAVKNLQTSMISKIKTLRKEKLP